MSPIEIQQQLQLLSPETPWAHLFEFSPGIFSVTAKNEQFFKKATGLKRIGEVIAEIAQTQVYGHSLKGKTVLDLACGEGGHAIQFAHHGAKVVGIEGRKLYVERARFAAKALGVDNVEFHQGDVRKLDESLGKFDVVIFSGILHHLGIDDFDDMLAELGRLTNDLLLIYTHVSTDLSIKNHNLKGPEKTKGGSEGYLFREHQENASADQLEQQVRASLDNTFSFWAREEVLIDALRGVGFPTILRVMSPHVFGWVNGSYRPILAAKKCKPA